MLAVLRCGEVVVLNYLFTGRYFYYTIKINLNFTKFCTEHFNVDDYIGWSDEIEWMHYRNAPFFLHVQVSTFSTASFSGWTKKRKTVSVTLDIILVCEWPSFELKFLVFMGLSVVLSGLFFTVICHTRYCDRRNRCTSVCSWLFSKGFRAWASSTKKSMEP